MPRKEYNSDSLSMLKGPESIRMYPGTMLGSDGLDGVMQCAFEIISNSLDEARAGFGDRIIVTKYLDNSVSVEDFGRGIPVDYSKKNERYGWEISFTELYGGGKYERGEGGVYKSSLGQHGLGLASTNFTSSYLNARIRRDGYEYILQFEEGENILKEPGYKRKKTSEHSGTYIHFLPDLKVFTENDIPVSWFRDTLKRQAIVNKGVKIVFRIQSKEGYSEEIFCYEDGISAYVKELAKSPISLLQEFTAKTEGSDREDQKPYTLEMNFAFMFVKSGGIAEHYHNSSYLEYGGSPEKAVRSAFTSSVDKYLKDQKKYLKSEQGITFEDICDSLVIVSNCFSTRVSFEHQTKKAVRNPFIQKAETKGISEYLDKYFAENRTEAEAIMAQLLINKRSREQSEKTRVQIKKKLTGTMTAATRPEKYIDCRSKDVEKRELFICEGDSALGSLKQARNSEFQALMPIRGKILNCAKVDIARIFKSDIITDLIKILGCGVEVKTGSKNIPQFDIEKLKFGKVIFCTDADVDGFQIRCLLLTMIHRLCPTLVKEGRIFIAETPLYEIENKGKTYFAYDEKEKNQILKKVSGSSKIQRSKGLGENDAEMMSLTTMNPGTRRLLQVSAEDCENLYEVLLGNDLSGRKDHIAKFGMKYLDELDV